jgi:hypothetical protein
MERRLFFRILYTLGIAFFVIVPVFSDVQTAHSDQAVFTTAGSTTWAVPAGVPSITVKAWGGAGSNSNATTGGDWAVGWR